MDFTFNALGAHDPSGNPAPAYGVETDDTFIYDPYASVCGRFRVDPQVYGLSKEQADRLVAINRGMGVHMPQSE